jgi:hypothetical protein
VAGYDGRGARFNIVAVEGNDLSFTVTAVDDAAASISLSAATVTASIYNGAGTVIDTLTDAVSGAGSNIITLSLTDAEVDALTEPKSWALVVERGGDARTWLAGSFTVSDAARARGGTSGTAITATVDTNVTVTATVLTSDGAVTAHTSDTVDAHDASAISILDAGGYYTSDTVEGALAELPGQYAPTSGALGQSLSPFSALRQALGTGVDPLSILLFGDSTGNGETEWAQEAVDAFISDYPLYTARRWRWDDTNQAYDFQSTIQTGSGGEPYVALDGTGDYISTPDATILDITGDLDVRVRVAPTDWTPAATTCLIAKSVDTGNDFSWHLRLLTTGELRLFVRNGGASVNASSTVAVASTAGVANGAPLWVRVTVDVDNGASNSDFKFYYSSDGESWTQLGATVNGGSVIAINASTAPLELGSRNNGASDLMTGNVYQAEVRNGIAGKVVAAFDAGTYWTGSTLPGVTGETWTLAGNATKAGSPSFIFYNASAPGVVVSYANDATRFALMTPTPAQLAFVSYGHNESSSPADGYETLIDAVRAKYPQCAVVLVQQNPQVSPRTAAQIALQRRWQKVIVPAVAAGKNCPLVDGVYDAIAADTATYMNADGIHPVDAGSDVWAALALAMLRTT